MKKGTVLTNGRRLNNVRENRLGSLFERVERRTTKSRGWGSRRSKKHKEGGWLCWGGTMKTSSFRDRNGTGEGVRVKTGILQQRVGPARDGSYAPTSERLGDPTKGR